MKMVAGPSEPGDLCVNGIRLHTFRCCRGANTACLRKEQMHPHIRVSIKKRQGEISLTSGRLYRFYESERGFRKTETEFGAISRYAEMANPAMISIMNRVKEILFDRITTERSPRQSNGNSARSIRAVSEQARTLELNWEPRTGVEVSPGDTVFLCSRCVAAYQRAYDSTNCEEICLGGT